MSICAPNCCSWQTAAPAAEGKKGRHLRFLPSLNTRFPWQPTLGGCGRLRKRRKKRTAEDFYYRVVSAYSHFGYVTATHTGYFPQTRHNSAAQIFYPCRVFTSCGCSRLAQENVLCGTGMPRLRGVNRLCSSTVGEMRIGVIQRGRKNPLPFPFFRSGLLSTVTAVPSKERQEFKEEGKP